MCLLTRNRKNESICKGIQKQQNKVRRPPELIFTALLSPSISLDSKKLLAMFNTKQPQVLRIA